MAAEFKPDKTRASIKRKRQGVMVVKYKPDKEHTWQKRIPKEVERSRRQHINHNEDKK